MLRPICKPARRGDRTQGSSRARFSLPRLTERGTVLALLARQRVIAMENAMKWETPVLCEVSVGMEVTSYQSADDSESIDSEI
jgi:coenzyme PQQ precursor peptide PqqA